MNKEEAKILLEKLKTYIQYCEQSERWAERAMNMSPWSRKGIRGWRFTTVQAKWSNCAEARDRIESDIWNLICEIYWTDIYK